MLRRPLKELELENFCVFKGILESLGEFGHRIKSLIKLFLGGHMGGKMSRNKGHSYEREIANRFKEIGFPGAKRKLEYQISEAQGYDIEGVGNLRPQLKRYKDYCPISKIEEVQCNGPKDIPILITRGDRKRDVVALYLDDFLKIIADIGVVYH